MFRIAANRTGDDGQAVDDRLENHSTCRLGPRRMHQKIGRVVMSGGAARLRGLTEYLSSTWSIPVEVARPLERIDVDPGLIEQATAAGPALAVAVGLALRHPGEHRE